MHLPVSMEQGASSIHETLLTNAMRLVIEFAENSGIPIPELIETSRPRLAEFTGEIAGHIAKAGGAMVPSQSSSQMRERFNQRTENALTDVEIGFVANVIAHAVACYKATESGSADTTVANTRAALDELNKSGPVFRKAVVQLADDRCGVDYTTHALLQPLAKAVLANEPGAKEALLEATRARTEELQNHPRVNTATEPLRFFCGVLRQIFNHAAAPELRPTTEEGWRNCRKFAMEVFAIAGITCADFDAHPERLTEYLGTDVSGT